MGMLQEWNDEDYKHAAENRRNILSGFQSPAASLAERKFDCTVAVFEDTRPDRTQINFSAGRSTAVVDFKETGLGQTQLDFSFGWRASAPRASLGKQRNVTHHLDVAIGQASHAGLNGPDPKSIRGFAKNSVFHRLAQSNDVCAL
jgi:hypothetical protein